MQYGIRVTDVHRVRRGDLTRLAEVGSSDRLDPTKATRYYCCTKGSAFMRTGQWMTSRFRFRRLRFDPVQLACLVSSAEIA